MLAYFLVWQQSDSTCLDKADCAASRLRRLQRYKETCMQYKKTGNFQTNNKPPKEFNTPSKVAGVRLQVGRVQPRRGGMTRVGACCPTISNAGWPDLTPRGSISISAASRSVTWKKKVMYLLWPVNKADDMCHYINGFGKAQMSHSSMPAVISIFGCVLQWIMSSIQWIVSSIQWIMSIIYVMH